MTGSNGTPFPFQANGTSGHGTHAFPEGVPTPQELESLTREDHLVIEELVGNAIASRQEWMRGVMADPRRNLNKECGFPENGQVGDGVYANLYERDPLAARVVQVMARESWQVSPLVYETEDSGQVTEWERAWDELGRQLRAETSYHAQEQGSLIWKYMEDADVLSGIDHYAILLLGLDDGKALHEPVEGWEEWFSLPELTKGGAKRRGVKAGANPNGPEFANTTETTYDNYGGGGDPGPAVYNSQDEAALNDTHLRNTLILNGLDPALAAPSLPSGPVSNAGPKPPKVGPYRLTINARRTKGRKLLYMSVFPETLAPVATYESNPSSPRFMQPTTYDVTFNDPRTSGGGVSASQFSMTRQVHWTRVVHVADTHHQATSSKVFAFPRMEPVLNTLLSAQKVWSAGAEGYWQSCFTTLSFETHPQLGGDVKVDKTKLKAMMYEVRNRLQRDVFTSGMAVKSIAPSVVDMTPFVETLINLICIKLGIPVRIFKGSERGELASTQDDAAWNDRVKQRQQSYLTPCVVVPVIDRLINVGVLPKPQTKIKPAEGVTAEPGEPTEEAGAKAEGVSEPKTPPVPGKKAEAVANAFDPGQPRGDDGKWVRAYHVTAAGKAISGGGFKTGQGGGVGGDGSHVYASRDGAYSTKLATHLNAVRDVLGEDDPVVYALDYAGQPYESYLRGGPMKGLVDLHARRLGRPLTDKEEASVIAFSKGGSFPETSPKFGADLDKFLSGPKFSVLDVEGRNPVRQQEGMGGEIVFRPEDVRLILGPTANVALPPDGQTPKPSPPGTPQAGATDSAEEPTSLPPGKKPGRPVPPPEPEEEPGYKVEWPDISSQSEAEKMDVLGKFTTALSAYAGPGAAPTVVAPFDLLTEWGGLDESRAQAILDNSEEHKAKQEADAQAKQQEAIQKGLVADPVKEQEAKIEALKSGKPLVPGQPGVGGGGKPGAGGPPAKPTPGFPAGRGPTLNEEGVGTLDPADAEDRAFLDFLYDRVTTNEAAVVVKDLAAYLHGLIDDVTLRDARNVARAVKLGVEEGYSDAQVANLLKRVLPGEDFNDYRINLIATTEMTRARGELLLVNAARAGEESVRFVAHPDCCDDCQRLNGREYGLGGLTGNRFDPSQARDEDGRWVIGFAAGGGSSVNFAATRMIPDEADRWNVNFDRSFPGGAATTKLTGDLGAGAVGVMRGVGAAADRFLESKRPAGFLFRADKKEGSRVRLYDRIAPLLAAKHGYSLAREEDRNQVHYRFDRIGPVTNSATDWDDLLTANAKVEPASGVIPVHPGCRCRWDRGADPLTGNATFTNERIKEVADDWFRPDGTPLTRAMRQTMVYGTSEKYGIELEEAAILFALAKDYYPRETTDNAVKHEPAGSSKGGQFVSQGPATATAKDHPAAPKPKAGDAPHDKAKTGDTPRPASPPPGTGATKGSDKKFATPQDIEAGQKKQIKPGVEKVTTADGKSYAVKQRGTADAGGDAEKQVSDLARVAGVNIPATQKQTVNGKPAVVTEWAEGGDLKSMDPAARKKFLQAVPKEQIDKHVMFDYLLGHGDTHNGNFIAGKDGSLVGIDKELWGHNGGHGKGTKFDIPQFVQDVAPGGHDTHHKFDRKHVDEMIAAGERMATAPGISPKDAQGIRNRVAVLKEFAKKPDAELTTGELWSAGQRGVPSAGGFLGKMKGMFGGG